MRRSGEQGLAAAYRASLDLASMCLQGWCISCAGRVEGEGKLDQFASTRYFPQDCEAGFIRLRTAKPHSDLRVHAYQPVAMREHRLFHKLPTPHG